MANRAVNPGPEDTTLLRLQDVHISEHLWIGANDRELNVRRCQRFKHVDPPAVLIPYLERCGFINIAHMGYCTVDHSLISALVERWRPETHTFHMPSGECTITLEDVAIITGLPIDGSPVTGVTAMDWDEVCQIYLGLVPADNNRKGGRISMAWLDSHFGAIPADADDVTLQCYARAYCLRLIGGVILTDHSSMSVHLMYLPLLADFDEAGNYSWGAASLAFLYRELCNATDYDRKEIAGPCWLLQFWAWSRFPLIAPTLSDEQTVATMYQHGRDQYRPLGFM